MNKLFAVFLCALFAGTLFAQQDIFVSPFGDDTTGDGSSAAPFRTVTKANTVALTPGDRIMISPGTYATTDGEVFPLFLGDGVSLIGPTVGSATLDGTAVLTPILVVGTSAVSVSIEQLRILGDGVLIQVFGNPSELRITDCSLLGGRRGIDRDFPGDTSILTVERCSILDMQEYGILWKLTSSGPGTLQVNVRDCVIAGKNLSQSGIEVAGTGGTQFAVDIQRNSVEKYKTGLRLSVNATSADASYTGTVASNSFRKEDGSGIEVRLDALGPGVASASMDVGFFYNLLEKNGDFGGDFKLTANGVDSTCLLTSQFLGNTVQFNDKSGLYFRESQILGGQATTLPDLGGGPSAALGANTFVFNDNFYQSGAEFDVRIESNDDVPAQGNWWFVLTTAEANKQGTALLETQLADHILDGADNPQTGTVDFSGYLIGDLQFTATPSKVLGTGQAKTTLVAQDGTLFVPGAGILPSTLTVDGTPILFFDVSPTGKLLSFTMPNIATVGGGPALIQLTLPAGQSGTASQSVVRTTDKGRLECFVATAAFGSPMAKELNILRRWRDEVLLDTTAGRFFVRLYYRYSPPCANWIAQTDTRRRAARAVLRPLIAWIEWQELLRKLR